MYAEVGVTLKDVKVMGNSATRGGGVYVKAGSVETEVFGPSVAVTVTAPVVAFLVMV